MNLQDAGGEAMPEIDWTDIADIKENAAIADKRRGLMIFGALRDEIMENAARYLKATGHTYGRGYSWDSDELSIEWIDYQGDELQIRFKAYARYAACGRGCCGYESAEEYFTIPADILLGANDLLAAAEAEKQRLKAAEEAKKRAEEERKRRLEAEKQRLAAEAKERERQDRITKAAVAMAARLGGTPEQHREAATAAIDSTR